jgi:uncharacterized protein YndB with AHSA1/START domain
VVQQLDKITHHTFTLERSYPHKASRVFAAFADPKKKLRWFAGGEGVVVNSYTLDFREGGFERTQFSHGGSPPATNECLYFQIVPNERIVYAFHMVYGGRALTSSLASIELVEAADGTSTLLRLTEQIAYLDGPDHNDNRIEGTRDLLERLGNDLDLAD